MTQTDDTDLQRLASAYRNLRGAVGDLADVGETVAVDVVALVADRTRRQLRDAGARLTHLERPRGDAITACGAAAGVLTPRRRLVTCPDCVDAEDES